MLAKKYQHKTTLHNQGWVGGHNDQDQGEGGAG